jgi:hypothetical protein
VARVAAKVKADGRLLDATATFVDPTSRRAAGGAPERRSSYA